MDVKQQKTALLKELKNIEVLVSLVKEAINDFDDTQGYVSHSTQRGSVKHLSVELGKRCTKIAKLTGQ